MQYLIVSLIGEMAVSSFSVTFKADDWEDIETDSSLDLFLIWALYILYFHSHFCILIYKQNTMLPMFTSWLCNFWFPGRSTNTSLW